MDRMEVVCGVLARNDRVLAGRRADVDGWEFPGGKVEDGESAEQALARELLEELGIELGVYWYLDTVRGEAKGVPMQLTCYVCPINEGCGPECREHAELRWLSRDELSDIDWLPADRGVAHRLGVWWDDIFGTSHL